MERKISALFKDLCCSVCKSDFDESSIDIMRHEDENGEEMIVFKLTCQNCGKSFGVAFLGLSDISLKSFSEDDLTLHIKDGLAPINEDDVIDAHNFIKKMDKDWKKFIDDIENEKTK